MTTHPSLLERWTRAVIRFRMLVLAGWLAVVVAGVLAAVNLSPLLSTSLTIPGTGSAIYDYNANTITYVSGLQDINERDQSMSVLLPPAQAQKVLTVGGGNVDTDVAANRDSDLIDLTRATPAYTPGPLLPTGTMAATGTPETSTQGKMYLSLVLLPNGKVFETGGGLHNRADAVFESSMYDPTANTISSVPNIPNAANDSTYYTRMLDLPNGQILFNDGSNQMLVYTAGGTPKPSWAPTISSYGSGNYIPGQTVTLTGTQLAGLDQGATYGDDVQSNTNFPLVRITNSATGVVTYARTTNWTSVSIAHHFRKARSVAACLWTVTSARPKPPRSFSVRSQR